MSEVENHCVVCGRDLKGLACATDLTSPHLDSYCLGCRRNYGLLTERIAELTRLALAIVGSKENKYELYDTIEALEAWLETAPRTVLERRR